jgi:hypothetical protein
MKDKPYSWAGAANADFDATAMNEFVGKYVLIAVTYVDGSGQEEASVQMHGVVTSVSEQGITISLKGEREGENWTMPANVNAISPAEPGRYQLPETGEIVENPDFITTWMVQRPRTG